MEEPDNKLTVPEGQLASPTTSEILDAYLRVPERLNEFGQNNFLPYLGKFLTEKGYIKKIDVWRGSWGFGYIPNEGKILINDLPMSKNSYNYLIFRLGESSNTGEYLFPTEKETDQYRMIHEVSHAFQSYLVEKERGDETEWLLDAVSGTSQTTFSKLVAICYKFRENSPKEGLTTFGNQVDYDRIKNPMKQLLTRSFEDANELVTLSLWHPEYFETFLKYLNLNIPNYTQANLDEDGLVRIDDITRNELKRLVINYITEMEMAIKGNV